MMLPAIYLFTYYSGDIHDYPSISFSVLISRQNTRTTLNMFQHGKLLWRMPISLLPRNLRKVEPRLGNTMTVSYAVLSYNLMTMSWNVTYQNGEALGNYEHTGKTKYTVLSDKEVLTHLYMRLNLRQALALHVYFIEIYFYHVILFFWTLTFQRRCLFQSKSLKRFPLGGKGSSNVSYLHV